MATGSMIRSPAGVTHEEEPEPAISPRR